MSSSPAQLHPARLRDVPALSRLLATAVLERSGRSPGRIARPVLVASIAAVMVLLPRWYHRERRVVVQVSRVDVWGQLRTGARVLPVLVVVVVCSWLTQVGLTLAGVYPLEPDAPAATAVAVEVGGFVLAVSPLVVAAAPFAVLAAHGAAHFRLPPVTWFVAGLAAEPGEDALPAVVALVRERMSPGQTVGATAADARDVVAYRRWGFVPVQEGSLVVTTRVPGAGRPA